MNPVANPDLRRQYTEALGRVVLATPSGTESPVIAAARGELRAGLDGLLGTMPAIRVEARAESDPAVGTEGYRLEIKVQEGASVVTIAAARDAGVLRGTFALLRHLQMHRPDFRAGDRQRAAHCAPDFKPLGQPQPVRRARLRRFFPLGLVPSARGARPALS
jgi:hypothetical protein